MDISKLRELCAAHKIEWTLHCAKRLLQRSISADDIETSITNGEIIEDYPEDYPFPSCLILGKTTRAEWLHVVCAIGDDKLWIITAYKPDEIEWDIDFRLRKGGS